MRTFWIAAAAGMLAGTSAFAQTSTMTKTVDTTDPYIWLEDKDGAKALAWVEAENAKTLPRLESDPRYQTYFSDALAIASAEDRIPMPDQRFGRIYNFWRDKANPHGIWRWTSAESYAGAVPHWTTALDIDALGKAEQKQWVWKGATCLQPEERLCLVALSEGGEDAVTYREFNLQTQQFVTNGFVLPKSKQSAAWVSKDLLLVARDWGAGTTTRSGYAFVLKELKRGQPLAGAREVFRGAATDQGPTAAAVLTDGRGNRAVIIQRRKTFFGADKLLWTAGGVKPLTLPQRTYPVGMIDGRVVFTTSDPWKSIKPGAIAWAPIVELVNDAVAPRAIFTPGPRQSVEDVAVTRDRLIAVVNDNVRGRALIFTPSDKVWQSRSVKLPDNASIHVVSTSDRNDEGYIAVTGFLEPTSLWVTDAAVAAVPDRIKQLPAKFDGSKDVVEQYEATSTDGTKIPYFIVHRKDITLDGATPTIMTAYGGFEISMTPSYSGSLGKLWLEQGGSYVLANIRGGGEFGPAWHDAGRKTKRQIIYDDFAAVAKDMFARKLTSPQKLGIYGGSNGGLLMGVEFNQHPDFWKAVTIQVPLLDMIRYQKIAAGDSWVDEYGSVDVPAERAFLETISPYQNLKKGVDYPEPYIWTTTKDDRVGPQHARKFAARMKEYGLPYLFYEDTAGGHSGDADIEQGARLQALQMVYFAQKLIGPATRQSGTAGN